jgi:hypothetical protein
MRSVKRWLLLPLWIDQVVGTTGVEQQYVLW